VLPEPTRTPSGYRDYGPEFIDRLGFVRRAQQPD
jgi:DNA-binding transcriptional MerR regulator